MDGRTVIAGEVPNTRMDIREMLEVRKIIEKAKGILMKGNGFSKNEAYQMIRKLSMDRRYPMIENASTIVISYD